MVTRPTDRPSGAIISRGWTLLFFIKLSSSLFSVFCICCEWEGICWVVEDRCLSWLAGRRVILTNKSTPITAGTKADRLTCNQTQISTFLCYNFSQSQSGLTYLRKSKCTMVHLCLKLISGLLRDNWIPIYPSQLVRSESADLVERERESAL